ncbi:hypothetical protein M231_07242 [Tremella mesenterica]|uniref:CBS domain-containing protein n=1 Tax=Tremella mesenterica TaxID=5217 RepID=A0A4V1M337_TREME|nr:hypothetical protein M231_07242 [Tremella mesenterica]
MDKDTTPTPLSTIANKYRGAAVEDLQLPPAICMEEHQPVGLALEKAYEHEFDQLPVLNGRRKPIGYVDISLIKDKFKAARLNEMDPVSRHTTRFSSYSSSHPYTTITPDTPLEILEQFFETSRTEFALVTDSERKWVLAVATKTDLETFVKRRG